MPWLWIVLPVALLVLIVAVLYWIGARAVSPAAARQAFLDRREQLQQSFFASAAGSGKPRGLRWKSIEWQAEMELVRDRESRQLAALVGVTVAFEAIPGSDMEGLPAVGNLRHGSAVFFYHRGAWHTTGKTIFNLLPDEVVSRFAQQYERVPGS